MQTYPLEYTSISLQICNARGEKGQFVAGRRIPKSQPTKATASRLLGAIKRTMLLLGSRRNGQLKRCIAPSSSRTCCKRLGVLRSSSASSRLHPFSCCCHVIDKSRSARRKGGNVAITTLQECARRSQRGPLERLARLVVEAASSCAWGARARQVYVAFSMWSLERSRTKPANALD